MGLYIQDNEVIVDHDVNEHLVTTTAGNPAIDIIDGLTVFSVFRRLYDSAKASRDRVLKVRGDNFPLIYALKGLEDLRIGFGSVKKLYAHVPAILKDILTQIDGEFDVIVPMPSSSPLADMLATRLSRIAGKPVLRNVFEKASNSQAMADIAHILETDPRSIAKNDAKNVRNAVQDLRKKADEPYSAKSVKNSVRLYFSPLVISNVPDTLDKTTRFLLVDDLLSTGGTLISARKLLLEWDFPASPFCVTWFSRAGTKREA